jgi:hypothetical protein
MLIRCTFPLKIKPRLLHIVNSDFSEPKLYDRHGGCRNRGASTADPEPFQPITEQRLVYPLDLAVTKMAEPNLKISNQLLRIRQQREEQESREFADALKQDIEDHRQALVESIAEANEWCQVKLFCSPHFRITSHVLPLTIRY